MILFMDCFGVHCVHCSPSGGGGLGWIRMGGVVSRNQAPLSKFGASMAPQAVHTQLSALLTSWPLGSQFGSLIKCIDETGPCVGHAA